MQDIDFDEIDRAVSSVTDRGTDTRTPSAVPSPAARRSSGRFMDVVHPSSDMRLGGPSAPSLHREDVVAVERTEVASRPEPAAISSSAFHWPDPVEVAAPAPIIPEAPSIPEEAAPLESPFLTDAKVEKRPLGTFSTNDSDADLQLIEDFPVPTMSTSVPEEQKPEEETPAPEIIPETTAEIPRELHADVLMLDTHSTDEAVPEPLAAGSSASTEAILTGPTSITQQYKEQPSTVSQPSGSIYDTEAYHQPLTHPAKKHSSALIIIWIVALILVGGGIGVGVYFVVLPMLG